MISPFHIKNPTIAHLFSNTTLLARVSGLREYDWHFHNKANKICTRFWRSCDRASWQISYNKPTRCTDFSNLFWKETLHVSDSSSVHHQEFFTVHTAMVYVIQVCWQLARCASCQQTCMTYTVAVCTVKNCWWWAEELSETCRVSFQNKFEKSVHVVGLLWEKCTRQMQFREQHVLYYGAATWLISAFVLLSFPWCLYICTFCWSCRGNVSFVLSEGWNIYK